VPGERITGVDQRPQRPAKRVGVTMQVVRQAVNLDDSRVAPAESARPL
jgi:hypothetical protein